MARYNKISNTMVVDSGHVPMDASEISSLLTTAYGGSGLDVLTSGYGLLHEADEWIVGEEDGVYHWFLAIKKTRFGRKFFFSGHDGLRESISDMKAEAKQLFHEYGVYAELSGAWEKLGERWGVPKVPVEIVEIVLAGKDITPVDEFSYLRSIGGKVFQKTMMGQPITPAVN